MHDAQIALTQVREAVVVTEYASDGDVTFASSVPPAYFDGCSLSPRWLLDADATFHVMSYREWFSTFSSGRLGCMHLHGSVYEIAGAEDICLSLPSGVLYTLCHVRYVPDLGGQSLISVRQLFDSGYHVLLAEHPFRCSWVP